jgi:hypothetical protein
MSSRTHVAIGRADDNDVVIRGNLISRLHARIEFSRNRFTLTDQSTNGTFVQISGEEEAFVRRDSMPIKGQGLIGLGRVPDRDSPLTIHFACEDSLGFEPRALVHRTLANSAAGNECRVFLQIGADSAISLSHGFLRHSGQLVQILGADRHTLGVDVDGSRHVADRRFDCVGASRTAIQHPLTARADSR